MAMAFLRNYALITPQNGNLNNVVSDVPVQGQTTCFRKALVDHTQRDRRSSIYCQAVRT